MQLRTQEEVKTLVSNNEGILQVENNYLIGMLSVKSPVLYYQTIAKNY